MHPLAPIRGGLRLACADLPPTLQPHAILAAAPKPDRRISALTAVVVYLGLGSGIVLLDRHSSIVRIIPVGRIERIWELTPEHRQELPRLPEPPIQPAVATTVPLPDPLPIAREIDEPPAETPTQLSETDRSKYNTRSATDQEFRDGRVASPFPAGSDRSTSTDGFRSRDSFHDFTAHPPRVLHAENPSYPAMARRSHVQGPVELLMTLDERGIPSQVQVLSGHPAFHAEAERAARLWRFEPATVDGRPVPARFRLTIGFRLK